MDAIALLRQQLALAHNVVEVTMADVTQEQADWTPPGVANPLGATYAHSVFAEDMVVGGMFRQQAPLFAGEWAGRLGMSEPMPTLDRWQDYQGWARSVRVDLPALRQYAQAVYAATDDYLASLSPEDLDRTIDMSSAGMGEMSWGQALSLLVVGHVNNMAGEISVLKGVQGARGYPF